MRKCHVECDLERENERCELQHGYMAVAGDDLLVNRVARNDPQRHRDEPGHREDHGWRAMRTDAPTSSAIHDARMIALRIMVRTTPSRCFA